MADTYILDHDADLQVVFAGDKNANPVTIPKLGATAAVDPADPTRVNVFAQGSTSPAISVVWADVVFPASANPGDLAAKITLQLVIDDLRGGPAGPAGPAGAKSNLLTNGGFDVWQRTGSAALTINTTQKTYHADRWACAVETNTVTAQRFDMVTNVEAGVTTRYYCRLMKNVNAGKFILMQMVEGVDCIPLRSSAVRVQVSMRRAVAASLKVRLALVQLKNAATVDNFSDPVSAWNADTVDPALNAPYGYITPVTAENGVIAGDAVTCDLTGAFVRYSATFNLPSNFKNLIVMVLTHEQRTAGDQVHVTEAALLSGADAQAWLPVSQAERLDRCQRYYQKTFDLDVQPVNNAGVDSGEFRFPAALAALITNRSQTYVFPTRMRTFPTVTTFNPSANNGQARDITLGMDCSATAVITTETGLYLTCAGNLLTLEGNHLGVHLTMNAEL